MFASFHEVCQTISAFLRLITCKIHIYIGPCGLETVIANVIPALKETNKVLVPPSLMMTLQKMRMNLSDYFSCDHKDARIIVHADYLLEGEKSEDEELVVIQKEAKYSWKFEHYSKIGDYHIFKLFSHPSDAECKQFSTLVSPGRSIPLYSKTLDKLEEPVEMFSEDQCAYSRASHMNCLNPVGKNFDREKAMLKKIADLHGVNGTVKDVFSETSGIQSLDHNKGLKHKLTSNGSVSLSNQIVEKKGRYESFTSVVTSTGNSILVQTTAQMSTGLSTVVVKDDDDDDSDVEIIDNAVEVIEIDDDEDDKEVALKEEPSSEIKKLKTEDHQESPEKRSKKVTNLLETILKSVGQTDRGHKPSLPAQQSDPPQLPVGNKIGTAQSGKGNERHTKQSIQRTERPPTSVLLESSSMIEKLNNTLKDIIKKGKSIATPSSTTSEIDVGGPPSPAQRCNSCSHDNELSDDNSQLDGVDSISLMSLEKDVPVTDPSIGIKRPTIPYRKFTTSSARTRCCFKARPRVKIRAAVPFERDTFYDICFLNKLYPHYDLPILKFNNRDIFNNPDYYHNFGQYFASGLSRDQVFQLDDQISQPVVVLKRL